MSWNPVYLYETHTARALELRAEAAQDRLAGELRRATRSHRVPGRLRAFWRSKVAAGTARAQRSAVPQRTVVARDCVR